MSLPASHKHGETSTGLGPIKRKQKSRSGCRACKDKRLKCDETKPQCLNCVKKGRTCPGYQQQLQWSTKYERAQKLTTTEPLDFGQLASAASQSIRRPEPAPAPAPKAKSPETAVVAKTTTPTPSVSDLYSDPQSLLIDDFQRDPSPAGSLNLSTDIDPRSISHELLVPRFSPNVHPFNLTGLLTPPQSTLIEPLETWNTSQPSGSLSNDPEQQDPLSQWPPLPGPPLSGQSVVRPNETIPIPAPSQPLVDMPSFLIEHWFKSVCHAWSAFDSQTNPYRVLSASLWGSSMSVFYALQSMAAASLIEHLPHVRKVAISAPQAAFKAITSELKAFRLESNTRTVFPSGLILSLFCMSQSLAWVDTRQLGLQFLKQARSVLTHLNKKSALLTIEERELLDFFNGCLIYEEMVRSVVSNDESDMSNLLVRQVAPQRVSVRPHAWTGVSPDLLRLFGKVMVLCRRSRNRWRLGDPVTGGSLGSRDADYEEARDVEEILLATEIPPLPPSQSIDEHAELRQNLRDAAEAYRLSSLLQLYQTFPEILSKRLPPESQGSPNYINQQNGWCSSLALHITRILEGIPYNSDMRCVQPLLAICAGSGLRYENIPNFATEFDVTSGDFADPFPIGMDPMSSGVWSFDFNTDTISQIQSQPVLTQNDFEISRARNTVLERLNRLEECLPPRPIVVAKQLLKAVWHAYDTESPASPRTHWLDVMAATGLHSLFG